MTAKNISFTTSCTLHIEINNQLNFYMGITKVFICCGFNRALGANEGRLNFKEHRGFLS